MHSAVLQRVNCCKSAYFAYKYCLCLPSLHNDSTTPRTQADGVRTRSRTRGLLLVSRIMWANSKAWATRCALYLYDKSEGTASKRHNKKRRKIRQAWEKRHKLLVSKKYLGKKKASGEEKMEKIEEKKHAQSITWYLVPYELLIVVEGIVRFGVLPAKAQARHLQYR